MKTSALRYRRHEYSGPLKSRKRVRAQLKRFHGEGVSRQDVWGKKRENNSENEPNIDSRRRSEQLAKSGPSTSSELPKTARCVEKVQDKKKRENNSENEPKGPKTYSRKLRKESAATDFKKFTPPSTDNNETCSEKIFFEADLPTANENKDQELCKQIKNSLKKLRRQSTGGKESDDEEPSPSLNLEVFPDEADNQNDETKEKETEESSAEFHDESEPAKEPVVNPKHIVKRLKPVKRNPIRRVVIEAQIQKDLIVARNAPALEKVFVNSINKVDDEPTKGKTKRARLATPEVTSNFDRTEQLYEFGKYVAEQLMCFDETDVSSAQVEIKEVLSKFRLKYKIMNCLCKPTNGAPETIVPPEKPVQRVVTKTPRTYTRRPVTKPATQVNSNARFNSGSSLPQPVPQMNIAGPSMTTNQPLPRLVSVVPSLNDLSAMNMNSSEVTPLGFIIVPTMTAPGFHITTQRVDSTGAIMTQPISFQNNSDKTSIQPTSQIISAATQPKLSLNSTETKQSSVDSTAASAFSCAVPQSGSSCMITSRPSMSPTRLREDPVDTTQGSSSHEPPVTRLELPHSHFVDVISINAEPESVVVKCEMDSDAEEET